MSKTPIQFALCLTFLFTSTIRAEDSATADSLRFTGKYEEALEEYGKFAEAEPVVAAIGIARCEVARGKLDNAKKTLAAARKKIADDARLPAELAAIAFKQGDHETARKLVDEAIKLETNQLVARWYDAELNRVTGKMEEANVAYRWFVRYYNGHQRTIKDAESLHYVGIGAAQYARWSRNSGQFGFLVNTLYPKALELNAKYWPASLESGRLFMEKYNEADALTDIDAALAINPNSAEIHVARAQLALQKFDLGTASTSIDRALELNPNSIDALHLRADVLAANFKLDEAAKELEKAKKLNPVHQETLGRLAAIYGAKDGLSKDGEETRMGAIIKGAIERNEHCGTFFFTLAATLEGLRKYPYAAKYYEEAQKRMPQLVQVSGRLGLMHMRLGDEVKGGKLLNESFEADPFNVRVKNMLAVLDVLKNYAVIETDHFIIKFDRGNDQVLAEYAARYLEDDVYPEIVERLGYEPKEKSLFEIFSRSGRTSGHSWFSTRMVGLPYIGTVGACAGKMVAIASPGDMPKKFNWARVLKHEFVHVVNLQQTDFNIPHWFTEACAVLNEGYERSPSWNDVLARRWAASQMYTLDNINFGFARPGSGDGWTLAYCQAELYAEYMIKEYGDDAIAKMLAAYADNLSTAEAIKRCFDTTQEEFEIAFSAHVEEIVKKISVEATKKPMTFAELQDAVKEDPKNAELLAKLAYQHLQRQSVPEARRLANEAREVDAKNQLAAYVLARVYLSIGDVKLALELLEKAFDENEPQENALALLAGLRMKAKKYDEAIRLYKLGSEKLGDKNKWLKMLARVYIEAEKNQELGPVLEQLAALNYDDVTMRKKLAEIALEKEQFDKAAEWANQAIQVNVLDADLHAMLARARAGSKDFADAILEFETALRLDGEHPDWRFELAKCCVEAKETKKARVVLEKILADDPDHADAKELLEKLE